MIFNLLLYALFLLLPLIYFRKRKLNAVKELGLEREKAASAWKTTLILFGTMFIVSLALGIALQQANSNDFEKVTEALKEAKNQPALLAFGLTIGVVLEEFFFRGFLIKFFNTNFAKAGKKSKNFLQANFGIIMSSMLFGAMHALYGSIAEILGAIALGLMLAFFWQKYKNLYANTYAHLLWNAMSLVFAGFV
jgi:membrane protease YdiL (CAAX protease family)